jgi:hypothetical protein
MDEEMILEPDKLTFTASLRPGRMLPHLLYVIDERGIDLNLETTAYGLKWQAGDRIEVTVRRVSSGEEANGISGVLPGP